MAQRRNQQTNGTAVAEEPNSILEETDPSSGVVTSYLCGYHIGTGAIQPDNGKVINSYYEMLLPCDAGRGAAVRTVASDLLDSLATTFELLPDGSACTVPDTWLDAWIIGASSAPADAVVDNLACSVLAPRDDATCCVVVKAPMTFWVTDAGYQERNVMKYIAEALNAGSLSYPTAYVGAMLDFTASGGSDHLPNTRNDDDAVSGIARGPAGQGRENVSLTGGFIIAGLALVAALGLALIAYRSRRERKVPHVSLDKAGDDVHATDCESNHGGNPDADVDATRDEASQQAHVLGCGQPCAFGAYDGKEEVESPQSYMFDMGDCMKSNIMAQYGGFRTFGPHSVTGTSSNVMDEASEGDTDSWAQTEGTVGSLEDNNYVGQITGEI